MDQLSIVDRIILDKILGCFMGAAFGDALGAGVEFMSKEAIDHKFPNGLRDFTGGGPFGFKAGDITDDTQQAILLAEALLEHEENNYTQFWQVFGDKLVNWAQTAQDIGSQTGAGIRAFRAGLTYEEAVAHGSRTRPTNGAVMRVYPVALMYYTDIPKMLKYTRLATAITHPHPEAIMCALMLNMMVSNVLSGKSMFDNIYYDLENYLSVDERAKLKELGRLINNGNLPAQSYTLARECLHVANYYAQNCSKAEDAIVHTCSFGGDNDTHGAVCGALVGALHGFDSLPARWTTALLEADRIVELSEEIAKRHMTPEAIIEDDEDDDDMVDDNNDDDIEFEDDDDDDE